MKINPPEVVYVKYFVTVMQNDLKSPNINCFSAGSTKEMMDNFIQKHCGSLTLYFSKTFQGHQYSKFNT
jgi:hypothetical protein